MKIYLCSWVMLFYVSIAMAQKPIVVIDPGHGGPDTGAIGSHGILEKEVVLKIAKECLVLNHTLFRDSLEIYLTRYRDTLISLGDRALLPKVLEADVFVSIHCNQAPNAKAQGFEIFLFNGKVNRKSYVVAHTLAHYLQSRLGIRYRGIKQANFQVLRDTFGHCSSILLETGFLSNDLEADHVLKKEGQSAIALALLQSLIKTFYHD